MKKAMQIVGVFLLIIIGPIALYFLFAWVLAIVPVNNDFTEADNGVPIYLNSNGVHVDICVPTKNERINWFDYVSIYDFKDPEKEYKYISIGWGDKGFYLETPTWADLKVSTAINSLFLPSPTALHITLSENEPQIHEKVKKVIITQEQYNSLVDFILEGFQVEESGVPKRITAISYYNGNDNFYEANGNYHAFKTCNCWTNQALKRCGVKTASWAPFEWGVFWQRTE